MKLKVVRNTDDSVLLSVEFDDEYDALSNPGFYEGENIVRITKGNVRSYSTHRVENGHSTLLRKFDYYDSGISNFNGVDDGFLFKAVEKFLESESISLNEDSNPYDRIIGVRLNH